LSKRSKAWLAFAGALVLGQGIAALFFPRGFLLTAFTDTTECVLLVSATLAVLPNARFSQGRIRLFWLLISAGMGLWLVYQLLWNYFEIYMRQDVPELFVGDVVLFLHVVPMMAALALQPHALQDERTTRFNSLDFALLLIWWLYLYLFCVLPWLGASPNVAAYAHNQNLIYTAEKIVFLVGLLIVWKRSSSSWKAIYAQLFGASLLYALASYSANWAIEQNIFYSGGVYDLPLVASMGWFTGMGLYARESSPKQERMRTAARHTVWTARLGMIAIFSLPLFAAWTMLSTSSPAAVRNFRLLLTLGTMMILGAMVFFKQHLLDKELMSLLKTSQGSFEDLKRLQGQLVQSEKMASLGQLLGGAAHELNNPITAMLGYSELLTTTPLEDQERTLADKIGVEVRNTRSLVASLLTFARQVPSEKTPVDLNAVVQTALKLFQSELRTRKVNVQATLAHDLPQILGDSNQLLQVSSYLINTASQNGMETEPAELGVQTTHEQGWVVLVIHNGSIGTGTAKHNRGFSAPGAAVNPKSSDVGLATCNGIVQAHGGRLEQRLASEDGNLFQVFLPVFQQVLEEAKFSGARLTPANTGEFSSSVQFPRRD